MVKGPHILGTGRAHRQLGVGDATTSLIIQESLNIGVEFQKQHKGSNTRTFHVSLMSYLLFSIGQSRSQGHGQPVWKGTTKRGGHRE